MSLKEVMAPAIRIAEQGYTVSKTLNAMMKDNFDKLTKYPAARRFTLKTACPTKWATNWSSRTWPRAT